MHNLSDGLKTVALRISFEILFIFVCMSVFACVYVCVSCERNAKFLLYFYLCMLMCLYVCVPHMCGECLRKSKGVRSLEQELQAVVSHHEGSGNQSWVLCKSSEYS